VPPLIDDYMRGDLLLDHYVTHRFSGIEGTLDGPPPHPSSAHSTNWGSLKRSLAAQHSLVYAVPG
jgi:hypothetical protein